MKREYAGNRWMRSWEWSDIIEKANRFNKWEHIWPVKGPIGELLTK
jgi:hypothetical protein